MKPKKFEKKLTLNKKTIADLNNGEMKEIQGGGQTWLECPSAFIPLSDLTCPASNCWFICSGCECP